MRINQVKWSGHRYAAYDNTHWTIDEIIFTFAL